MPKREETKDDIILTLKAKILEWEEKNYENERIYVPVNQYTVLQKSAAEYKAESEQLKREVEALKSRLLALGQEVYDVDTDVEYLAVVDGEFLEEDMEKAMYYLMDDESYLMLKAETLAELMEFRELKEKYKHLIVNYNA